jgi:hypothetical protein
VTEGGGFDTRGTRERVKALEFTVLLTSYGRPFIHIDITSQVTNEVNKQTDNFGLLGIMDNEKKERTDTVGVKTDE